MTMGIATISQHSMCPESHRNSYKTRISLVVKQQTYTPNNDFLIKLSWLFFAVLPALPLVVFKGLNVCGCMNSKLQWIESELRICESELFRLLGTEYKAKSFIENNTTDPEAEITWDIISNFFTKLNAWMGGVKKEHPTIKIPFMHKTSEDLLDGVPGDLEAKKRYSSSMCKIGKIEVKTEIISVEYVSEYVLSYSQTTDINRILTLSWVNGDLSFQRTNAPGARPLLGNTSGVYEAPVKRQNLAKIISSILLSENSVNYEWLACNLVNAFFASSP